MKEEEIRRRYNQFVLDCPEKSLSRKVITKLLATYPDMNSNNNVSPEANRLPEPILSTV